MISYSWGAIEGQVKAWIMARANARYPYFEGCNKGEIEGPPACNDGGYLLGEVSCVVPILVTYNYDGSCSTTKHVEHAGFTGRWHYSARLETTPEGGPCCDGKSKTCVGNPCDPSNGNKYEYDVDYAGGPGIPSFGRAFNSIGVVSRNSSLGTNWTHTYARSISVHPMGDILFAARAQGTQPIFKQTATGGITPRGGLTDALTKQANGWTYRQQTGVVEHDTSTGQLLSETDANGKVTSLGYNAAGQLVTITGPYGHVLTLGYATQGRLATLTDPTGKITTYGYNANSDLSAVTYPNGTGKQYHYEDANFIHHLTGVSNVDAAGVATRFSTFGYDTRGLAILTQHAQTDNGAPQERFTLTYPPDYATSAWGNSAWGNYVTDAVGTAKLNNFYSPAATNGISLLYYTMIVGDASTNRYFRYDSNNNLTCRYDYSGAVSYTYNATSQRISKTDNYAGACAPPSTARLTTYQYLSPTLDIPTVTESPSVAGGANRKRTTLVYGDPRFPTQPTGILQEGYTPAGVAVARTITLGYNAAGQVSALNGPRLPGDPGMNGVDDVTTLAYYDCATGGACGQLRAVTNALGQTTVYGNYTADGRVQAITDPNGRITRYTYDPRGRVASVTLAASSGASASRSYTYTPDGQVKTLTLTPDPLTYTYAYDAAQDLKNITDTLGNQVTYAYDAKGNRTQTLTVNPDSTRAQSLTIAYNLRNQVTSLNHGGNTTTQLYDGTGQLVRESSPNDVAAANGHYGDMTYDSARRLLTQSDSWGANYAAYAYDMNDQVTQVTGPSGTLTTYAYDDLGNLLQEVSPDRGTTPYSYDIAGNVVTRQDANAVLVTYTYDALNRLTLADYPGADKDTPYVYDSDTGCTFGLGRLCRASVGGLTTTYAYDAFGYLTDQVLTLANTTRALHTDRDAWGRVTGLTYPGGRRVTYTRDPRGRLSTVSATVNGSPTPTPLISQRTYRADDQLSSQTFGNGLTDTRLYTDAGRLSNQFIGTADTRVYGYDYNGNLTSKQSLPEVATYTYNRLDQLTADTDPTPLSFGYVSNSGNRTSVTGIGGTSATYTPYTNRLATLAGKAVTLSPNGNLLVDPVNNLTYTYTSANDLATVTQNGNLIATYTYDPQHLRIRKVTAEGTILYHYDDTGHLLQETDSTGALLRSYVWADDMPIAQLIQNATGERLLYLHTDNLNTPRLATGVAGKVRWRWEGNAFGDTVPNEDPTATGVPTTINLRYAGQYFDRETGLHYNWNRYYDPRLGRYITSDPIGLRGGLNTYTYVRNNPLRYTDPLGLLNPGPMPPLSPPVIQPVPPVLPPGIDEGILQLLRKLLPPSQGERSDGEKPPIAG